MAITNDKYIAYVQDNHSGVVAARIAELERENGILKQDAQSEFLRGVVEGLSKYAWWKDGTVYVGTCGTTLQQAIERASDEYRGD